MSKRKKLKRIANHFAVVALVCLLVFFSLYFNENAYAMQEVGSVTLNSGENGTFAIGTDGTYAYVGTNTSPAQVVKVRLSDLSRVGSVTLNSGENYARSIVTDGTYAYVLVPGIPSKVVKIRLSDLSRIGAVSLEVNAAVSMVTDGTYAYVGTNTHPAQVVKVRLSDLSRVGSVTLNSGENGTFAIGTDGTYAYVGTNTSPAQVVKVRLSDLSRVGSVTLNSGENTAQSMVTDGIYAYVGTNTSPAQVVKVRLSDLSRVGSVTLNSGENTAQSMVTDGIYAYVGTNTSPAMVVKVWLGDPATAPATPAGFVVTSVSQKLIDLRWQPNTEQDLAGYKLYRNNSLLATVDKNTATYSDTTVVPGTTYTYEITAYNTSNLESGRSSPVPETVTTPPATPTGITGQASGRNITLTWQGTGNPCYIVERSTDGISFTQVAEVSQISFTETAPLWGTTYYYRVAQKGQDVTVSYFSEVVQITTGALPVPENLQTSASYNIITLIWDSGSGAAAYIIQRSMDEGANWGNLDEVTQTTYIDDGLGWNLTFSYRILSKSGEQVSDPSAAISATTDNVPAPTGLTASLDDNDVILNWQPAPYVSMYIIERSTDGQNWESLIEVGFNNTYTDLNLDMSNDYYYRVKSDGGNQVSGPSNTVKVTTPPAIPTNLRADVSGKTVTLTWESPGNTGFVVERSTDGHVWGQVAEVAEKTCRDTAPRWETTYYYRVIAKNTDGMVSEPSEPVQAVTSVVPAPENLRASVSENTIILTWNAVSGIGKYRIERSRNGISWSGLIDVNKTTYTDSELEWEAKYYYRVRSWDGDQTSAPSEVVTAQTQSKPVPNAPRLVYSVDGVTVKLSWDYQRSCDGYRVYINNALAAEPPAHKTSYVFTGERGENYKVKIEAYNAHGVASSEATILISEMVTPGAGQMAGDVLKYTGVAASSMGGLLALGLALKGNNVLMAIVKLVLGR